MSFARRSGSLFLLAAGILGCPRAEPVTPVGDPTRTDVPSAFSGLKAGDERKVAGIKLCWCPAGKFIMGTATKERQGRTSRNDARTRIRSR